ncbi:MAG: family 20 glycosylhydrolase, partial [Victivallales bacterium]|nr:family 20 glycosylhydrolase [Victivallales bacterium]
MIRGQFFSMRFGATDLDVLIRLVDAAADGGMNLICLEIEKAFRYESHPEVSAEWAWEPERFAEVAEYVQSRSMEFVPLLPTLTQTRYITDLHPEFAEPESKVICPSMPEARRFQLDLIEEILDVVAPIFFHIGHDEPLTSYDPRKRSSIFKCSRCSEKAAHELFAADVAFYRDFLAERGVKTMMWADSLLNPDDFKDRGFYQSGCYGGAPDNLAKAAESLPRDIVMCDWHYEPAREYPTVEHLQKLGFQTIACPAYEVNAALFARFAARHATDNLRGFMATTWCRLNKNSLSILEDLIAENAAIFAEPKCLESRGNVAAAAAGVCDSFNKNMLKRGVFNELFSFKINGRGAFHSLGWCDFRYMEWECHDPPSGKKYPDAMMVKANRAGEISYEFSAENEG